MPFPAPSTDSTFGRFFRGWNRLEARSRRDNFAAALAAAIADPLWQLGRQWQLLELKGENAGSPIRTAIQYEVARLDQLSLGDGQSFEDIGDVPVEVLVEREEVGWDWRMRVRAGQQFERLARLHHTNPDALIRTIRDSCPVVKPDQGSDEWINLDYAARRFVSLMAGRAIDGEKLFELIRSGDASIPSELAALMMQWHGRLYSQATGKSSRAWKAESLDYEFRIRAGTPPAAGSLRARSYRKGSIDWHTFVTEGAAASSFEQQPVAHPTPVHVAFDGQPKRRWWEFEDGAVDFGTLDTAKTDLGKLLLTEFALVHGDDWFVVPLRVMPNSLVRVLDVRVRDCFGVPTSIPRAEELALDPLKQWVAYGLAPQGAGMLYVPPSIGSREESPTIEEVQFARDEDANVLFAIEHIVPNQLREPTRGFSAHLEAQGRWQEHLGTVASTQPAAAAEDETQADALPPPPVRYVLATKVPQNWIPFIATDARSASGGMPLRSVRLQRGEIVSTEADDERRRISALSRLLAPEPDAGVEWIDEEAVGRAGVRVELKWQRTRSAKGEAYVWLGRSVRTGRGQARSGLRFDVVRLGSSA